MQRASSMSRANPSNTWISIWTPPSHRAGQPDLLHSVRTCARVQHHAEKPKTKATPGIANRAFAHLQMLDNEYEQNPAGQAGTIPEVLERAALNYEPHQVAQYLRDLAASSIAGITLKGDHGRRRTCATPV